jgi:hypothetical protein
MNILCIPLVIEHSLVVQVLSCSGYGAHVPQHSHVWALTTVFHCTSLLVVAARTTCHRACLGTSQRPLRLLHCILSVLQNGERLDYLGIWMLPLPVSQVHVASSNRNAMLCSVALFFVGVLQ